MTRLAVLGGGWAGLAAAVRATEAGAQVTLFEMAAQLGGRARTVDVDGLLLDNGQHILIGAYRRTLALMHDVGCDVAQALQRRPLELRHASGDGLRVPPGPAVPGFVRAVLGCRGWGWRDRASLLAASTRWAAAGFRCAPELTVQQLCARLTPAVRRLLIDPLCVAALNTPAGDASAAVMLRVLRDALFGGAGSADLLLPCRSLGSVLPQPAALWLQQRGATLHLGRRVQTLERSGAGWRVDGQAFEAVVLACSAAEAARLVQPLAPEWSQQAAALPYEPIITVYLRCPGARLPAPMTALAESDEAPAQFAFDHGALGATPGLFAFVVSGARRWTDLGLQTTGQAVLRQAQSALAWPSAPVLLRTLAEKRATFRCVPLLARPPTAIAPGLAAAGDYIEGPYPATLEGAVRSGEAAVNAVWPQTAPPAARR